MVSKDQKEFVKNQVLAVEKLGEEIGYGQMMSLASALWRRKLRMTNTPENGAFVPVCDFQLKKKEIKEMEKSNALSDQWVKYTFNE